MGYDHGSILRLSAPKIACSNFRLIQRKFPMKKKFDDLCPATLKFNFRFTWNLLGYAREKTLLMLNLKKSK